MQQRLVTAREAAEYCGLSIAGFRTWRNKGIVPGPVKGTNRYDFNALNRAIDRLSGLTQTQEKRIMSAFDKWEIADNENRTRAHSQGHKALS